MPRPFARITNTPNRAICMLRPKLWRGWSGTRSVAGPPFRGRRGRDVTRPLYGAAVQEPASREPDGHAGLWFDKFCNQWQVRDDSWTMSSQDKASNPKLDWIRTVADCPIGIREQLDESTLRLTRLIHRRGGRVAVFTAEARFVTGLGRSHPVENGFAWHPTLGTPYLPGSSVKGLVRSWAEMDAEPRPDARTRERLLGAPERLAACVSSMLSQSHRFGSKPTCDPSLCGLEQERSAGRLAISETYSLSDDGCRHILPVRNHPVPGGGERRPRYRLGLAALRPCMGWSWRQDSGRVRALSP